MSSWWRRLRRLTELDGYEVRLALAAQLELLRAWWLVRRRTLGDLLRSDDEGDGVAVSAPGTELEMIPFSARAVTLAIVRASSYGLFEPTCLVRALALRRLLVARGHVGSEIRVGVRKEAGMFAPHNSTHACGALAEDASTLRRYVRMNETPLAEMR